MRRRSVLVFALVVVVAASTAVAAGWSGQRARMAGAPAAADDRTDHEVTFRVAMQPDGDARWTVTTYVDLETDNDTEAFREQADEWEAGTYDRGLDVDLFRDFAGEAAEATGRDMAIPAGSVERTAAVVDNGTRGALRLSFTWTNFGRMEDGNLVLDDAFRSTEGVWLDGLAEGQRLVVSAPEGWQADSIPEGARLNEGSVLIWNGPETFSESYFAEQPVVFGGDGTTPSDTPTNTPTTSPVTTSPPPGPEGGSMGLWLGVGAAVLLGGGLALYRRMGSPDESPAPAGATTEPDGGDAGPASAGEAAADPEPPDDDDELPDDDDELPDDDDGDESEAAEPEPTPEDPFAGVDEALLSDEERVLRLLEANGGRMKQANIVTETGWSNAKVSQLLSSMDDDEKIDKLRIGRENLISLPDVDVGDGE